MSHVAKTPSPEIPAANYPFGAGAARFGVRFDGASWLTLRMETGLWIRSSMWLRWNCWAENTNSAMSTGSLWFSGTTGITDRLTVAAVEKLKEISPTLGADPRKKSCKKPLPFIHSIFPLWFNLAASVWCVAFRSSFWYILLTDGLEGWELGLDKNENKNIISNGGRT